MLLILSQRKQFIWTIYGFWFHCSSYFFLELSKKQIGKSKQTCFKPLRQETNPFICFGVSLVIFDHHGVFWDNGSPQNNNLIKTRLSSKYILFKIIFLSHGLLCENIAENQTLIPKWPNYLLQAIKRIMAPLKST